MTETGAAQGFFGNLVDMMVETWFTTYMTTTPCLTCQIEAKRTAGTEITNQERNHSMLWGCTCTPEAEAEALAHMDRVTR